MYGGSIIRRMNQDTRTVFEVTLSDGSSQYIKHVRAFGESHARTVAEINYPELGQIVAVKDLAKADTEE